MKFIIHKSTRLVALFLTAAMILPIASCKKSTGTETGQNKEQVPIKKMDVQYVQETDPYFSDTQIKFELPVNEARTVEGIFTRFARFVNDKVIVGYDIGYIFNEEEQKEFDSLDGRRSLEELKHYFDMLASREEHGVLLFSLSGEVVSSIKLDPYEEMKSICVLSDGRVAAFVSVNGYEINEEKNEVDEVHEFKLVYFTEDGQRQTEYPMEMEDMYLFEDADIRPLSNGNLLVLGSQQLMIVSPEGTILGQDQFTDECTGSFEKDGKYYVILIRTSYTASSAQQTHLISEVDIETGTLGAEQQISADIPEDVAVSDGVIYTFGDTIQKSDILSGTSEVLVDYNDTDVSPIHRVCDVRAEGDKDLYILNMTWFGSGQTGRQYAFLTHLHKEDKNPFAGRCIVHAASCRNDVSPIAKEVIAAYNKRPESKARVVLYEEEGDGVGYYAQERTSAADKLLLAMRSGNGPDVLINCAEFGEFNTDRILADLNPFLDGENGIDRSQYFDNVFRAYELDGSLFQMPLAFTLSALIGNPDLIGRPSGWTLSDFETRMDAIGGDVIPLLGWSGLLYVTVGTVTPTEQMGLLLELLFHDMTHYVDYNSLTVNFDSDDFRKMLEAAKKYAGRLTQAQLYDMETHYGSMSILSWFTLAMQDGVSALDVIEWGSLENYAKYKEVCGGDPAYIGWPTSKGEGYAARATMSVGISAYSGCQDAAWDFVKYLLLPEVQTQLYGDRHINLVSREGSEQEFKSEVEEYENMVELYKNEPRMLDKQPVLTMDLIPAYMAEIEKIRTPISTNPTVMAIVMEEAQAFFSGSKSADDVSKTIQNRVTTLLNET